MKSLLGIVFLGLLLSGCFNSNNYESFVKRSAKNNIYTAKAQSILSGAWSGGQSAISREAAANDAINRCNQRWNKNDCVLHSIGNSYVFEESKQDYKIKIAQNTCKKVGYSEGTESFADCTVKVMVAQSASQTQGQTVIVGQRRIRSIYPLHCRQMGGASAC